MNPTTLTTPNGAMITVNADGSITSAGAPTDQNYIPPSQEPAYAQTPAAPGWPALADDPLVKVGATMIAAYVATSLVSKNGSAKLLAAGLAGYAAHRGKFNVIDLLRGGA